MPCDLVRVDAIYGQQVCRAQNTVAAGLATYDTSAITPILEDIWPMVAARDILQIMWQFSVRHLSMVWSCARSHTAITQASQQDNYLELLSHVAAFWRVPTATS